MNSFVLLSQRKLSSRSLSLAEASNHIELRLIRGLAMDTPQLVTAQFRAGLLMIQKKLVAKNSSPCGVRSQASRHPVHLSVKRVRPRLGNQFRTKTQHRCTGVTNLSTAVIGRVRICAKAASEHSRARQVCRAWLRTLRLRLLCLRSPELRERREWSPHLARSAP
jgi:hypothetical protein